MNAEKSHVNLFIARSGEGTFKRLVAGMITDGLPDAGGCGTVARLNRNRETDNRPQRENRQDASRSNGKIKHRARELVRCSQVARQTYCLPQAFAQARESFVQAAVVLDLKSTDKVHTRKEEALALADCDLTFITW